MKMIKNKEIATICVLRDNMFKHNYHILKHKYFMGNMYIYYQKKNIGIYQLHML